MSDQDQVRSAAFEAKALSVLQQMVEEQRDNRDIIMGGVDRVSKSVTKISDVLYAVIRAVLGLGMIAGASWALWEGKITDDKWLWACIFAISPEIVEKVLNKKLSISDPTAKLLALLILTSAVASFALVVGPSVM